MTDIEILENGRVQVLDVQAESGPPHLRPGALRRLARMGAAVEGATEVAQAAVNVQAARRAAYQQAFEAACEDVSLPIPPGQHDVDIDWNTGAVRFTPK